ncbi:hypothetical protein AVO44_18425 [Ruegeria profundi]|uniref:Uncharacterized protein n=1 Tax=Ruegeria profundi TaxID=1685378 RepID=A0A0X3TN37_9RHOB|nr:hypothetical protein AVO44_18425 [Ruegeria profundi]
MRCVSFGDLSFHNHINLRILAKKAPCPEQKGSVDKTLTPTVKHPAKSQVLNPTYNVCKQRLRQIIDARWPRVLFICRRQGAYGAG